MAKKRKVWNGDETVEVIVDAALRKSGYKLHPAVATLEIPLPGKTRFRSIVGDIKANGLNKKIIVSTDGRIVDGVVRFVGLVLAGLKPTNDHFEVIDGDDKQLKLRAN